MTAAKYLLYFLCYYLNYGIELGIDLEKKIKVYINASHKDNPDRKSIELYIVKYKGSLVS